MIPKQSPRLDSIKEEDKNDYWTHTASRPTGSKKDTVRKHIMKGKYVVHARHVLEKTQSVSFVEFQTLHPEIKQQKSEQLKPFFLQGNMIGNIVFEESILNVKLSLMPV